MKLIEGESYNFSVLKKVELPEEGEFYVLRHQSGRRLMLPVGTYKNFGIEVDQNVVCKVDKVNCTGKVYLEPKHPYYEVGDDYEFEPVDYEISKNDKSQSFIKVKDCFNNHIKVICAENMKFDVLPKKLNLKVIRIKKGIPQLIFPSQKPSLKKLESLFGKTLDFKVREIGKNQYQEDVYILTNQQIYNAELKVKHFQKYGFKPGDIISCKVYGVTHLGMLKVEPKHPYYEKEQVYQFTFVGSSADIEDVNNNETIAVVTDYFSNKCGVKVDKTIAKKIKNKTQLKCRVVGFRKGRPSLVFESC